MPVFESERAAERADLSSKIAAAYDAFPRRLKRSCAHFEGTSSPTLYFPLEAFHFLGS